MTEAEPDPHLLNEETRSPVPEWNRPEPRPPATVVASDHPIVAGPGHCQICQRFTKVEQYWPATLPTRYVDLCEACRKLGDMEIARRLPPWRRDGAVI